MITAFLTIVGGAIAGVVLLAAFIAACFLLAAFLAPLFLSLMEEAESAGERVAQALYTLKRRLQGKPDHGFDSCPTGVVNEALRERAKVQDPSGR